MSRAPTERPCRIILLIPSAREFDRGVRRGIVEYAHTHGRWILLDEAPPYLETLTARQSLRSLRAWGADGAIVPDSRWAEVRSLRIPTVVVGMHTPRAPCPGVACANEEIGRLGARCLTGLGLRHFAFCGLPRLEFSDRRRAGFEDELAAAGHAALVYPAGSGKPGEIWYAERRRLARWLSRMPKPAGLMACNDDRARMLAEICRMEGIRVPDEIAILGVDNDEMVCRISRPPLSSIVLATERAGYNAAARLAALLRGEDTGTAAISVYPTHVVPRQSTDLLAIEDPGVARAVRFIRENPGRQLRVGDLARVAGLSRRALQDAFVRSLGRTPMEEIHSRREERIARLLTGTDLPVSKIAEANGFEFNAHLSRFFSRRTGMTPLAYRKKHRI